MDITLITSALSGIKSATDIAKIIKEADFSLEKAELKFKIADLMDKLIETKAAIFDIQELLLNKDAQIKKLEDHMSMRDKLRRHLDAYYEVNSDGSVAGPPFCTRCFEVDRTGVHLLRSAKDKNLLQCPQCNTVLSANRCPSL